jgi:hypothetical protein
VARAPTTQELGVSTVLRLAAAWVRVSRAWRRLSHERRLAAVACIGLVLSMFLPWYQETVVARSATGLRQLSPSLTGWGAFSFAEAALLLVAAGVLCLLFERADGRELQLPWGDGGAITAAGGWACLLIVWRMFDKPGTSGHGALAATAGVEWGIFVALALAGLLTYAGTRIRRAGDVELSGAAAPAAAPVDMPGGRSERGDRTGVVAPSTPAGQAARRSRRPPGDRRPPAALDPSEIAALELPEPPTIRVGRTARLPDAAAEPSPGEDQLTLGFEHPPPQP